MQLIDQFERVYIINLPHRTDRRREMQAELARVGLRVDGQKIRFQKAIRPDDAGAFPSLGARGCYLSHLSVLNEAIDNDLASILVMEDDLSIDARFANALPAMCQTLQQGHWSFAYLGHVEALPDEGTPPSWCSTQQALVTAHFYALNRPVIRQLRDHLLACLQRPAGDPLGGPMHVDGAYSMFRAQHPQALTLIASPSLGGQRSSRSDIYPNKWYDRTPGLMHLAAMLRAFKNLRRQQRKVQAQT